MTSQSKSKVLVLILRRAASISFLIKTTMQDQSKGLSGLPEIILNHQPGLKRSDHLCSMRR